MIKIAFFDVDGTLLKLGHRKLSTKTEYALRQLQKNGILICMATGRSFPALPKFENIEFDIYLCFNGSYVCNKKEVIRKIPMDKKDVITINNNLNKMGRPMVISNEETLVANGTDDDLIEYLKFGGEKIIVSEKFADIRDNGIYQIMCSCKSDEYSTILKGTRNTQITAWWDRACDIVPKASGKGLAVFDTLKHYGISKNQAIAFGDGGNDIDMLKAVGTGVAMGNAKDEVKQIADEICPSVEDDGIYHYCLTHNLINAPKK